MRPQPDLTMIIALSLPLTVCDYNMVLQFWKSIYLPIFLKICLTLCIEEAIAKVEATVKDKASVDDIMEQLKRL